ncbi:PTS glucose transporter subunit IIA [uncultured Psychrosphaera sp.]|jgi:PTS system glucose-specific IIA component|uniref:PTS glucose transporter subunit IIA n=1 Tax=uncultured Psychrosphaera sp. TaxID=1403522 RepID=UPI00260AC6E6|nr:PTS glucose transporter subunit IIA [uncultured Psychrosphaera sp.]
MLLHSIVNFTTLNLAKGIKIGAPVSGKVFNIAKLAGNQAFYKRAGEGVAIKMEGHQVNSPISGTVIDTVPSHGKVIIQAKNKLRFLLQFPFEYIKFNGIGIKSLVTIGQTININDPLLKVDLYKMNQQMKPIFLYFILLDVKAFKSIEVFHKHVQIGTDPIFSLVPKPVAPKPIKKK